MGGGEGGRNPGVMVAGSLREAGEEGGGRRDIQVEKWEKFRNIGTIFRNRNLSTPEAGTATEGGRNWECKVREAGSSNPLPPPPPP